MEAGMNPHSLDVFTKLLALLSQVVEDMTPHNSAPLGLWHDDVHRNVVLYRHDTAWRHILHATVVSSAQQPLIIIRVWREDVAHTLEIRLFRFRRENNMVTIRIVPFYKQRTL